MSVKKSDKYDLLLNSGLELFAKKGYHQTKIKDITDHACLAAGTFYLYFKNKEELIEELFKRYLKQLLDISEKIHDSNTDAYSKLEEYIRVHIQFFYENKIFFQFYLEHIPNPVKNFKKCRERFMELTKNIIQQGQIENVFTEKISIGVASNCLRGMITTTATNAFLIDPIDITPQELSDNIFQLFINGIKKC